MHRSSSAFGAFATFVLVEHFALISVHSRSRPEVMHARGERLTTHGGGPIANVTLE